MLRLECALKIVKVTLNVGKKRGSRTYIRRKSLKNSIDTIHSVRNPKMANKTVIDSAILLNANELMTNLHMHKSSLNGGLTRILRRQNRNYRYNPPSHLLYTDSPPQKEYLFK